MVFFPTTFDIMLERVPVDLGVCFCDLHVLKETEVSNPIEPN